MDCNPSNSSDVGTHVGWTRVSQSFDHQDEVTELLGFFNDSDTTSIRTTIDTAKDQAKFICHSIDMTMVYAIHYVSIKGIE